MIEWGTSRDEVEARLEMELWGRVCALGSGESRQGWFADFGKQVPWDFPVSLEFFESKFFRAAVDVRPTLFTKVESALINALGAPTAQQSSSIQNRMGTSFDQEIRHWDYSKVDVLLVKRGSSVDQGILTLTYKPIASLADEETKKPSTVPF